jgi:hypothetical protein
MRVAEAAHSPTKGGNMKSRVFRILTEITAMTMLAALATPVRIVAQEQQQAEHPPHYTVTDLGTLGGTYSFAFGIKRGGEQALRMISSKKIGGTQ